jgi:predicted nucleic acid-binding protein
MHGESDEAFARLSAITDLLAILPLPKSAGESYGEIQADLESKGEMIGNNDLGLSRTHWLPG